jgi:hypothetical protein
VNRRAFLKVFLAAGTTAVVAARVASTEESGWLAAAWRRLFRPRQPTIDARVANISYSDCNSILKEVYSDRIADVVHKDNAFIKLIEERINLAERHMQMQLSQAMYAPQEKPTWFRLEG